VFLEVDSLQDGDTIVFIEIKTRKAALGYAKKKLIHEKKKRQLSSSPGLSEKQRPFRKQGTI
jgi:Holliday junction resolvase-like predicted endonuclease